jgi:hypothetical protein
MVGGRHNAAGLESIWRWHHAQTLASGQVAEFKVWAELVRQSMGGLHVFLPMRDVGIDGVLHRIGDGAYQAVQVKGRMSLTPAGQVHITVTASSLGDESALIVATLVDKDQLGSMVLVVDEGTFRRLASHDIVGGREYLTAAFEMHAGSGSRWAPFLVPRERLAERFGAAAGSLAREEASEVEADGRRGWLGFVGEAEVVRRLAEAESLNLFRPFPDLETVEVLARHVRSGRYLGVQVKTSGWDAKHVENRVHIRRSSFRPSPSTFVCVLGWDRSAARFEDDCILIPSADIAALARMEGPWLVLELQPGSHSHRQLDPYRTPLRSLGHTVESLLQG